MEYIIIPPKSKSETAFLAALKEAVKGPRGNLNKVKAHLSKIAAGTTFLKQ